MKYLLVFLTIFSCSYSKAQNHLASPKLFFSYPDMITAALSPDGKKIAAIRIIDNEQHLVLLHEKNLKEKTLLSPQEHAQKDAGIKKLVWLDNQYLAVQFSELRKGIEDLLDSKISRRLLIIDIQEQNMKNRILSVRTQGWLAHPQPDTAGKFLFAKSGSHSKIYNINISGLSLDHKRLGKLDKIDGGQFKKSNEVISVEGYATRWFLGSRQEVRAVLHFNRKRVLTLTSFDENGDTTATYAVKDKDLENKSKGKKKNEPKAAEDKRYLMPIALADKKDTFYCLDLNEEETQSIYRVNFSSKKEELVYEINAYEILDLLISDRGELIGAQVQKDGAISYEYINDENNNRNIANKRTKEPALISIYDTNSDESRFLAYIETHNSPGEFILLDKNKKNLRPIGKRLPKLSNIYKTTLIEDFLELDELKIPYLLTLPKPTTSTPFPLVVMPHGGPIGVHDDHYYDRATHFFSANGFAVLRVNYRGSSGHTSALKNAGKKEWGGKMLSDIHEAVKHVVARKDIASQHVCAIGFSYGGYASTMLMLNHPDTYRCAATIGGVADINLYINSPNATSSQKKWLKEQVGDPKTEYEYLQNISPLFKLNQLQGPLFVAHGFKDNVVDVEHAYRTKLMLEKYKKNFEWYLDEESGHHFSNPKNKIALFSKILTFLENNIR